MANTAHAHRISQELRAAGATAYGVLKFSSSHLPNIIYDNEHIEAVVYGRYGAEKGLSMLGMIEGMLVATNYRVLFIDHKPGYTLVDDLTYYTVTGVQRVTASIFSSVTLFTRTGNYTLRFANNKCAENFVRHIEMHHLGKSEDSVQPPVSAHYEKAIPSPTLDEPALTFLKSHNQGVLSTLESDGTVRGVTVYYLVTTDNLVYTLARDAVEQAHTTVLRGQVALTAYDPEAGKTLQLKGAGTIETEAPIRDHVLTALAQLRTSYSTLPLPSVPQLRQWSYTVIRIVPSMAQLIDYLHSSPQLQ